MQKEPLTPNTSIAKRKRDFSAKSEHAKFH